MTHASPPPPHPIPPVCGRMNLREETICEESNKEQGPSLGKRGIRDGKDGLYHKLSQKVSNTTKLPDRLRKLV